MSFGNILKKLRQENNLTQDELAKKINTSRSNIANYENDKNMPSVDILEKLSHTFNCSTDYLMGKTNKKNIDTNDMNSIKNYYEEKINVTLENKYYEWLLNGEGSGLRSGMIDASGIVNGLMNAAYAYIVRPTFYLKSNVFYKSGIGTQENPYRIGI